MASSAAGIDWTGFGALADTMSDKKEFPIVVIGAGLGRLVSAAYLSKYGFNVTLMEQHSIPGLSDYIEVMEIGTPLTNVFYTGNLQGAIYGFDRDMPHLEAKTPIKGLYLASAWSHGGGYTPVMMAGLETAMLVLKDFIS